MSEVENLPPIAAPTAGKSGRTAGSAKPKLGGDRKKLQTLQPSGKNQKLLVGSDGLLRMSGKKDSAVKIYSDPQASSTPERKSSSSTPKAKLLEAGVQASVAMKEGGTQVEDRDTAQAKADEFMYGDDFPVEYWKELAEKRREALEASLLENEDLHTSLNLVEEEKSFLAQERDGLKEMAEQAEELAKIVNGLVTDDAEESDESDNESEDKPSDD
eukprot:GFUD01024809.1.p1 GENE.GFUD01024809.1~~GFUD01024809.1.p1  ORF type:complete len:215 (-),score=89.46 GFUD01024809.1:218-862(-)